MGDRTSVTLTILESQKDAAKTLFSRDHGDGYDVGSGRYSFHFYDVNYGELEFLPALRKIGIAYDSQWNAGDEYGAGGEYCRFTEDGLAQTKEHYDCDNDPDMAGLLERIDDPVRLRQYILTHKENREILPWDNQEEYGKRYRARQLIQPT